MSQSAVKTGDPVPKTVLEALEGVVDPEIPVLTIRDLGVLRDVRMDDKQVVVTITPTYSGCPAMRDIRDSIHKALLDAGCEDHRVETSLSPAWTTDWMSEEGRRKLLEYGIAPPSRPKTAPTPDSQPADGSRPKTASTDASKQGVGAVFGRDQIVACPQCGSENTGVISEFGSTACKAMYRCKACLEPFDHFKCH